ncbi:MAG TPA: inorganic phosphate transporter [Ferruginibacter sp.]|nr:inorganic phosphate transporter [Ferruginibacter sp.]HMP20728.1 inorganic phosphate transporter [Ferruginibacter sp.]
MTLLIVIIILALLFDYINGFHDAANSIATIVSTKVLTPVQAVIWAAFFNFVAFFIFKDHAVANTIGKTVHAEFITLPVILSGLIAAIFWNLLTWWYGIPSSSSHTLIGGFAGAAITHALVKKGVGNFNIILEMEYILKILFFIFLAPLIGMVVSIFITVITIMRNTWLKIGLILLATAGTWFLFQFYQMDKLKNNVAKYYNVDVLEKEAKTNPAATVQLQQAINAANAVTPLLSSFNKLGGEKLAEKIKAEVDPNIDSHKLAKALDKADNSIQTYVIFGLVAVFILTYLYVEKVKTPNAYRIANMFKKLQLFSSAAFSVGHGGNDAQKVMGIIAAAYVAYYGTGVYADSSAVLKELTWVPLACYTAIGLGTMSGGWKIVKTMGTKITKVTPLEGVAAETSGAFTLFVTEQMGIPVSTTHTITGSIIGVGATKRLSAVRWGVTVNLLWAWILTIPVSALLAGLIYMIVSFFLK